MNGVRRAAMGGMVVGFWSWLAGKRNRLPARDCMWLTSAARNRGVCRAIKEAADDTPLILVAAHFPASLEEFQTSLTEAGIEHDRLDRPFTASQLDGRSNRSSRVLLTLCRQLQPDPFPNPSLAQEPILILVGERHFLRKHDDAVLAFAESLSRPCVVTFHLSLEDPLLRPIGGEWVQGVLLHLGATEQAPIESEMISRRIPDAQVRFARYAEDEKEADSAEEWLQLNVPGG